MHQSDWHRLVACPPLVSIEAGLGLMRNILIVEDEPFIAFDLEEGLQQAGFNVIAISKTTTDALCAIERGGFDGVVLDALLQGNSAAPIAHALRAKNVPFIVVSGYEMKELDWLGDTRFVGKPFNISELVAVLKQMLSG